MDLGKLKARYVVHNGDVNGSLELFDDGLVLNCGRQRVMRYNYVDRVEKVQELPLGKVGVEMRYFDLFGNRESTQFAMRDNDWRALQNALHK